MRPSLLLKINADVHRQKNFYYILQILNFGIIISNPALSAALQTVYHRLLMEHLSSHHVHYYF